MKKKVLCIESNNSLGMVIKTVLSDSFRVSVVNNIFDAMDQLPCADFDCIVLSVEQRNMLPAALLHHLDSSAFFREIPVVMLSDYEDEQLSQIRDVYEVAAFFRKPFDPLRLADSVKSICYPVSTSEVLFKKRKFLNLN
ncbi:MAG: response regulator [Chitinophagaceae bacterium]|nr:response regulator [Chitinophagaceae bacterium]MCW5913342.1 response regulator [Chitinophagaceae bacterium]MCZ2395902.1 response regulator [Chitinophagales bacterium]